MKLVRLLLVSGLLGGCLSHALSAAEDSAQTGLGFLKRYCFDCHGDGQSEGHIAFGSDHDFGRLRADRKLWSRVWDNVLTETMPPADMPQPAPGERKAFSEWIASEIYDLDPSRPDPGRVVIRRLNRSEYRSVIKDLLAIDFDVDGHFPPDDTGYGFDTIGEVLGMSPALTEKYFQAAEQIASELLAATRPTIPVSYAYKSEASTGDNDRKIHHYQLDAICDGEFVIKAAVKAGKDFAPYYGHVAVDLIVNGRWIESQSIDSEQADEYSRAIHIDRRIDLKKGPVFVELHIKEQPDLEKIQRKIRTDIDGIPSASINAAPTLTGPLDGSIRHYSDAFHRVFIDGEPPNDRHARQTYASRILGSLLRQGFRRPVEPADLDRFMALYVHSDASGATFEEAICQCVTALLISPRFLMREEHVESQAEDVETIDEYSLASRLSFFLWSSIPDEELLTLAGEKKLREQLDRQIERMLKDPKSNRFVTNFVGQWLQTRDVLAVHKSDRRFDLEIRKLMKRETEQFFEHLVRGDRPIVELLDADYTFLNDRLADFYQLPAIDGGRMRKVTLAPDSMRGGVLTHGSVLMVTSNPNRTSPVKRGKFILENILGAPPPPPPKAVPDLEEARKDGSKPKTVREQLAIHREDSACASCHNRMDPLGLAYENFDHVGRFRATDNGEPIDTQGSLVGGRAFENVRALQKLLVEQKRLFFRCLTQKLMVYSLGRGLEPTDTPVIEGIVDRVLGDGERIQFLIGEVIRSPQFQRRKRPPVDPLLRRNDRDKDLRDTLGGETHLPAAAEGHQASVLSPP